MTSRSDMARTVSDRAGMIAGMAPRAIDRDVVFCTTRETAMVQAALPRLRALVAEDEGVTLVLDVAAAIELGLSADLPMRQITLDVASALDGVGLTAAVAGALSDHDIPCNVVAGACHDHLFVPADRVQSALHILRDLQRSMA